MNRLWHGVGTSGFLSALMAIVLILLSSSLVAMEDLPRPESWTLSIEAGDASFPPASPDTLPRYVGTERCESCHRPEALGFTATRQGEVILEHPRNALERLGCESCHGPGSEHSDVEGRERTAGFLYFDRDDPAPVEAQNAACLQCHEGADRMDWLGSAHEARDVACVDCHQVMRAVSERAQLKRATVSETCAGCHVEEVRRQGMSLGRMPVAEGKMDCASCHNPHGTVAENLLVESSVNEVCYACHAEKRGPFLWEHAPVVESCLNCHDPHGSQNPQMLAMPMPRLCHQCHVATGHPSAPQTPTARFVLGRQCANCHVAVHGSNHPSGMWFVR